MLLSGCKHSAADRPAPIALNEVPGGIRAEFQRLTPAPARELNAAESEDFAKRLMISEEIKNSAGQRLINQIDRARAFHALD